MGKVKPDKTDLPNSLSGVKPVVSQTSEDYEIIKLIIRGEKENYRILVERYQQMIFKTCLGFLHNKEDADDLTQDIFIQIYQSLSTFKNKSAFSTWIYRIAVNASLNKVRKSSRTLIFQRLDNLFLPEKNKELNITAALSENPENILISQENRNIVTRALDTLPENQRTAIILSKYDDMSQKEIAEIMNISESAVEALLHRAKKNLHKKLAGGRTK